MSWFAACLDICMSLRTILCSSSVVSWLLYKNHLKVRPSLHLILLPEASPNFLRLFYRHTSLRVGWGQQDHCVPCTLNSLSKNERVPALQYKYCTFRAADICLWTFWPHWFNCWVTMQSPGKTLKEALLCAQSESRLTVGVYQSAKIMTE